MEDRYDRIINEVGVKTTICKNRFEILCFGSGEVNEAKAIQNLREWIYKRRQDEMRESGDMPEEVS